MSVGTSPRMIEQEAFRCLRLGDHDCFNAAAEADKPMDFSGTNLRAVDFRKIDMSSLIIRGAYLREADLRGKDLSGHDLAGCTLHNAKVGGVLFPECFSAHEIRMSLEFGTRLRAGC